MPINVANEVGDSPSYAAIFGPVFWGFCVTLILFGVSLLQGYLYFTRYHDRPWLRCLATGMLTLDCISIALISQSVYYYLLPHFGSFAPLSAVTKELSIECLISAAITYASQMHFVYQLYLARSAGNSATIMKVLVATILLGTVGLGGAVGCVVMMLLYPQEVFTNRNHTFVVLSGIARGVRAAADILATVAMCLFLKSADDEIIRPSSLLRSLMHLIINRGILVTAAQILLLVTFFGTPNHLYWIAVHINTTKLYSESQRWGPEYNGHQSLEWEQFEDVALQGYPLRNVSQDFMGEFKNIGIVVSKQTNNCGETSVRDASVLFLALFPDHRRQRSAL
ncbi:hypothetical protein DFH08DRAFT_962972 [Mycena albidolilacea]|uniref:DUF6534 domain-containing protein n=1 Tax=Mycena albidolilacea TaxID=1033008 RepID=A0AAD7EPQ5_9AGAR|nr:hypothetical protein DFH08DRAFT_962972 [Mycena albidolilacea]